MERQIIMYLNQKPWMNRLLKSCNSAFRLGDAQAYSTSRANLKKGINKAKHEHKPKVEEHCQLQPPRHLAGHSCNHRLQAQQFHTDSHEWDLDKLNDFLHPFQQGHLGKAAKIEHSPDHQILTLTPITHYNALSRINTHEAAGPDSIPGHVLRACAVQLAGVFTDIPPSKQQYQSASRPPP